MAEITTLSEAVAETARDGDLVALEGFTHLIPFAAVTKSPRSACSSTSRAPSGARRRVPPLSIGDGELADTADTVVSVPEIFNNWLQAGRIDLGLPGAAQIDRRACLNTMVIGPYEAPTVLLPGAGGALTAVHPGVTVDVVRATTVGSSGWPGQWPSRLCRRWPSSTRSGR